MCTDSFGGRRGRRLTRLADVEAEFNDDNVNKRSLHIAAHAGHDACLRALLEGRADKNATNGLGQIRPGQCTGIYEGMVADINTVGDGVSVRFDAAGCPAFHATVRIKSCCFCKKYVGRYGGNSPHPANITDGARCCDACNMTVVLPARLGLAMAHAAN